MIEEQIIVRIDDELIVYKNIQEASDDTLLRIGQIRNAIATKRKINGMLFSKMYNDLRGCHPNKSAIPIQQLDRNGNIIAEFGSAYQAYNETGICNINRCLKGHLKTAGGFIWKYKEELM